MYVDYADIKPGVITGNNITFPVEDMGLRNTTVSIEYHKGQTEKDDYIIICMYGDKKKLYRADSDI